MTDAVSSLSWTVCMSRWTEVCSGLPAVTIVPNFPRFFWLASISWPVKTPNPCQPLFEVDVVPNCHSVWAKWSPFGTLSRNIRMSKMAFKTNYGTNFDDSLVRAIIIKPITSWLHARVDNATDTDSTSMAPRLLTSRHARTSRRLFHLNTSAHHCESDDSEPSALRLTAICLTTDRTGN